MSTINSVYANNVCINNAADGIAHEISFDAVIKDNIVCFNGDVPTNGWLWGAGINIQNSGGYRTNESYSDGTKAKAAADSGWIDVHDNIVVVAGRGNGMSTLFQNRGEDHTGQGYGTYTPVHVKFRRNKVHFVGDTSGRTGLATSGNGFNGVGPVTLQDAYDTVHHSDNTYYFNTEDGSAFADQKRFAFDGSLQLTVAGWQAAGNDLEGVFADVADAPDIPKECYASRMPTTPFEFTVLSYPLQEDLDDQGDTKGNVGEAETAVAAVAPSTPLANDLTTSSPVAYYKYWLATGCSDGKGAGETVPIKGRFGHPDRPLGRVQCCTDEEASECIREVYSFLTYENECLSPHGPVTYTYAEDQCARAGGGKWRLCTKAELESDTSAGCCGARCDIDDELVWTTDKKAAPRTTTATTTTATTNTPLQMPASAPTPALGVPGTATVGETSIGGEPNAGEDKDNEGAEEEDAAGEGPTEAGNIGDASQQGLSTPALAGIIAGGGVVFIMITALVACRCFHSSDHGQPDFTSEGPRSSALDFMESKASDSRVSLSYVTNGLDEAQR